MDTNDATIVELRLGRDSVSAAARAHHGAGIGRVGFVLIDLSRDPAANIVERKDVDYAEPPTQVDEAWTSQLPLVRGAAYRAFFHVYDRTGVNLVAYDRRDFTWC
jgi:hypothetical protein